jgi:Icc-related predicted phosphoesterase
MRIVYATDIHGAWKPVKALLENTNADLYIIAGDLLKKSFRSHKNFFRFNELQNYFKFLKCRSRNEAETHSFVMGRLYARETNQEERHKAREYLRLHQLARKSMLEDLTALESMFSTFPHKRICVLPGNYDIDLRETALRERDLHKAVFTVDGIRIAGYGGANIITPGVPEDMMVHYREYQSGGTLDSEPRDFLSVVKPD